MTRHSARFENAPRDVIALAATPGGRDVTPFERATVLLSARRHAARCENAPLDVRTLRAT